jgi:5-methylcytosine-specific restriction protein A
VVIAATKTNAYDFRRGSVSATFIGMNPRSTPRDDSVKGTERIRGRRLQAIRRAHFQANPLCVACKAANRIRLATQVDHIVPLFKGGEETEQNRQGLCDECHERKTAIDLGHKTRPTIGLDGWPVVE